MARWIESRVWIPGSGYATVVRPYRPRRTLKVHELAPLTDWKAEPGETYRPTYRPAVSTTLPYQGIGPRLSECRCIGHDPDPAFGRDVDVTTRVVAPTMIRAAIDRARPIKLGRSEAAELTHGAYCTDRVRYESVATPEDNPAAVWDTLLGYWYPMIQRDQIRTGEYRGTRPAEMETRLQEVANVKAGIRKLNHDLDVMLGIVAQPVGEERRVTAWVRHLERMRRHYTALRKAMVPSVLRYRAPNAPMVRPAWERPVFFAAIPEGEGEAYQQEAMDMASTFAERFALSMLSKTEADTWRWFDATGTEHWVTRSA